MVRQLLVGPDREPQSKASGRGRNTFSLLDFVDDSFTVDANNSDTLVAATLDVVDGDDALWRCHVVFSCYSAEVTRARVAALVTDDGTECPVSEPYPALEAWLKSCGDVRRRCELEAAIYEQNELMTRAEDDALFEGLV